MDASLSLVRQNGKKLTHETEMEKAISILIKQEMYRYLSRENLILLAQHCEKEVFKRGELLVEQGQRSNKAFFLVSGNISRFRTYNDQEKILEKKAMGTSINSLHHLQRDHVYASARCDSHVCVAYSLKSIELDKLLEEKHDFTREVIQSLSREVRDQSKVVRSYRTPLFETQQRHLNLPAITIAAGMESYYRSAMNAFINYSLTGQRANLFPNMGVQVPSRISYVLGFKTLRYLSDHKIDYEQFPDPRKAKLFAAVLPGIIMCPISSVLEASNAGHLNSEPLVKRWVRGFTPRIAREVIFGVGLNQLSDVMEERIQGMFLLQNQYIANMLGSLSAGILAGYFSHVPHNLSTLKLMHPKESYSLLFQKFVRKSLSPRLKLLLEATMPKPVSTVFGNTLAILFPRGCLVRTVQIIGTFVILNSTINYMSKAESRKIDSAVKSRLSPPNSP